MARPRPRRRRWPVAVAIVAIAACGGATDRTGPGASRSPDPGGGPVAATPTALQRFPTVLEVALTPGAASDSWDVAVTISSPYDAPERYADAFRVETPDGTVLGVRELTHHHADEQPFTRSLLGVEIPPDLSHVVVTARDSDNGWANVRTEARVPRR